jgi:hypothetical protein
MGNLACILSQHYLTGKDVGLFPFYSSESCCYYAARLAIEKYLIDKKN